MDDGEVYLLNPGTDTPKTDDPSDSGRYESICNPDQIARFLHTSLDGGDFRYIYCGKKEPERS